MTNVNLDELLTVRDVCTLFGRSRGTITNWIKDQDFPHVHLPGGKLPPIRFPKTEVISWAKRNNKEMPGLNDDNIESTLTH